MGRSNPFDVEFSLMLRSIPKLLSKSIKMSSAYTTVSTTSAPGAIGPYSQAIKTDSLIFLSGCIPLDPVTMKVVEGGVEEQTVSLNSFAISCGG